MGQNVIFFFSSNGLYRNVNDEDIRKKLVDEEKYEWKSLANAFKYHKELAKIIYVRDVYTAFYIYGINKDFNNIDKILEKLKVLSDGYKITTVGILSGGYLATICAAKLNAMRGFCIAGQFDLTNHLKTEEQEYSSRRWKDYEYFNICNLIKKNKETKIFYFCSSGCQHDYFNYQLIKDIPNVYSFLFPDEKHVATVYPFNFPDLLFLSNQKLEKLCKNYDGKLINKDYFYIRTVSLHGIVTFLDYVRRSKLNLDSLKKKWDV